MGLWNEDVGIICCGLVLGVRIVIQWARHSPTWTRTKVTLPNSYRNDAIKSTNSRTSAADSW